VLLHELDRLVARDHRMAVDLCYLQIGSRFENELSGS
jgi:hypothetical protein